MVTHIILYLLYLFCLLPAYIFRKRIRYLYCPEEILGYSKKKRIFFIFNFVPSFTTAIVAIINSRVYFQTNIMLAPYENYSILAGLIVLLILLFMTGYFTDRVLYIINIEYKIWKNVGLITKFNDPPIDDMS